MIHHELNCPKPGTELATGTKGDTMERCTYCRAWAPIGTAPHNLRRRTEPVQTRRATATTTRYTAPVAVVEPEPDPEPAPSVRGVLTARYVCRDHGRPVTWKGTGCRECRAAHADRQRDREHAALARRERAERDRQG